MNAFVHLLGWPRMGRGRLHRRGGGSASLAVGAAAERCRPAVGSHPRLDARFMAAVYLVPWFTQALARATGVQIFTLIAAALGAYALHVARQPAGAIAHPEPSAPLRTTKV